VPGASVRDQERRDRGVEPEADDVDELTAGTYDVATSKDTLVAPSGKTMPRACGKDDELKFTSRVASWPTS
jgi:hypothetical protein